MPQNLSKSPSPVYEIRILGRIDPERAAWFGDWQLSLVQPAEHGVVTVLIGRVTDQAVLFGLISQVRDLGLQLLSVNQIDPNQKNSPLLERTEKR
jgi:hypothetical protein